MTDFIRNTSLASLRDYLTAAGIEFPTPVNWDAPEPEVVRPLLQAVDQMDDDARGRVINDGQSVSAMADVAGQTALYSMVDDREVLDEFENGHARALWLFINDLNRFRHAEEVRFTDERRRGRSWDGFICEANLNLRRDEMALNACKAALRQRFASRNVHVDIFELVRPTFEGEDCDLVQITVYREGLQNDQFAFDDGELVRRACRPVFEAAMSYEPVSGVIEVVASDRESRAEMAQYLARDLLGVEFRNEKVPMRRYDLTVLRAPHAFPTDIEDGIERVEVRQLRLMPIDAVGERVTLETMSKAERDIWTMAEARLGPDNPLAGGWVATQAKLVIKFQPKPGARRGRTLALTITMPHGCNLKDQTEEEQLIGEKYLRRWGVVVDDPIRIDD